MNSSVVAQEKKLRQLVCRIAEKYLYSRNHALLVEKNALKLFDVLRWKHKYSHAERLLLSHASLLHDSGSFIGGRKHHRHTKYILDHEEELEEYPEECRPLLALIAYNHGKKLHRKTMLLPKKAREKVLTLSALLRLADAMAYDSELQEILIRKVHTENDQVKILVDKPLSEIDSARFSKKKKLFEEVFKLEPILLSESESE